MRIAVIGAGFVGLPFAAVARSLGAGVTLVEQDAKKRESLEAGELDLGEPGLAELLKPPLPVVARVEDVRDVKSIDCWVIAVGTPQGKDGAPDLRALRGVVEELAKLATSEAHPLVVLRSTVPVGTTDEVALALSPGFSTVFLPEFLREGHAVKDLRWPTRVVVGAAWWNNTGEMRASPTHELLGLLYPTRAPYLLSYRAAEAVKYVSNGMLANRISWANAVADWGEAAGFDACAVLEAVGADPRIGDAFLTPGPGYGCSCFPKDLAALERTAPPGLAALAAVTQLQNERARAWACAQVRERIAPPATIAVWGLACKAGTGDVRDSPAVVCVEQLLRAGYTVRAHDIVARWAPEEERYRQVSSAREALEGAGALVVATEWPPYADLARTVAVPLVVDARGSWRGVPARPGQVVVRRGSPVM